MYEKGIKMGIKQLIKSKNFDIKNRFVHKKQTQDLIPRLF